MSNVSKVINTRRMISQTGLGWSTSVCLNLLFYHRSPVWPIIPLTFITKLTFDMWSHTSHIQVVFVISENMLFWYASHHSFFTLLWNHKMLQKQPDSWPHACYHLKIWTFWLNLITFTYIVHPQWAQHYIQFQKITSAAHIVNPFFSLHLHFVICFLPIL